MSEDAKSKGRDPLFVNSLERGLKVLFAFDHGYPKLKLSQITEITGLGKSATQRFVHTWRKLGYLEQDPQSKEYSLSPRVLGVAFNYMRSDQLVSAAMSHLVETRRTHRETINLGRRVDTDMIFIVRLPGRQMTVPSSVIGDQMPMYCTTSGRAILAMLPEQEARKVIDDSDLKELTPSTITDPDELMAKVRQAREDGFSIAVEEGHPGLITIGAAIQDYLGNPIAAVNFALETKDWNADDVREQFGPVIVQVARSISESIGYFAAFRDA